MLARDDARPADGAREREREAARRRREAAKPRRDVWVWEDVDGLAQFGARLSTEHAHALLARIDHLAHADANRVGSDPTLTIGERRAQALLDAKRVRVDSMLTHRYEGLAAVPSAFGGAHLAADYVKGVAVLS